MYGDRCSGKNGLVAVMFGSISLLIFEEGPEPSLSHDRAQPARNCTEAWRLPGNALFSEQGAGRASVSSGGTSISEFGLTENLVPSLLLIIADGWFSLTSLKTEGRLALHTDAHLSQK